MTRVEPRRVDGVLAASFRSILRVLAGAGLVVMVAALLAMFDGYQFVLRAPRADGDHWVALEPDVLVAFDTFVKETLEEPTL